MTRKKLIWIGVPILLGFGVLAWQLANRPEPAFVKATEREHVLRVLTLEPIDVVPKTIGYGVTQPGRTWRAIARVEGRVTSINEWLRPGERLEGNDLLLTIATAPYELEIARLTADIARTRAELEEFDQRLANDRASLNIERNSLELARGEWNRLEELRASGNVSQSAVDQGRRDLLLQEQSVQALDSSLSLLPSQKRAKEAALLAQEASLEQARLDLGYTKIEAPFNVVLGDVDLQEGQFVGRGEVLFEAYGMDRADLDAQFLYGDVKRLLGAEAIARLATVTDLGRVPEGALMSIFRARVRMTSGDLVAEWSARVTGMREVVDSSSRALTLRVAVDDPFTNAVPGVRPPLLSGTFCEVELLGLPLPQRLVVPRSAVRNGAVFVLDHESRMRSREVRVAFDQDGASVIEEGLEPGDRVIVSEPRAAIEGALVKPVEDVELAVAMRSAVAAEARE